MPKQEKNKKKKNQRRGEFPDKSPSSKKRTKSFLLDKIFHRRLPLLLLQTPRGISGHDWRPAATYVFLWLPVIQTLVRNDVCIHVRLKYVIARYGSLHRAVFYVASPPVFFVTGTCLGVTIVFFRNLWIYLYICQARMVIGREECK